MMPTLASGEIYRGYYIGFLHMSDFKPDGIAETWWLETDDEELWQQLSVHTSPTPPLNGVSVDMTLAYVEVEGDVKPIETKVFIDPNGKRTQLTTIHGLSNKIVISSIRSIRTITFDEYKQVLRTRGESEEIE